MVSLLRTAAPTPSMTNSELVRITAPGSGKTAMPSFLHEAAPAAEASSRTAARAARHSTGTDCNASEGAAFTSRPNTNASVNRALRLGQLDLPELGLELGHVVLHRQQQPLHVLGVGDDPASHFGLRLLRLNVDEVEGELGLGVVHQGQSEKPDHHQPQAHE